jgi:hypothetical protein
LALSLLTRNQWGYLEWWYLMLDFGLSA